MFDPARIWLGLWASGLLIALSLSSRSRAADARPAGPVVAGFERFDAAPKSDTIEAGLLLLGELGCTSCHKADPGFAAHLGRKQAPVLDGVGSRVRASYIRAFLADPHATKPGTTMPDVLAGLDGPKRGDAVELLTHFLASTEVPPPARIDRKSVAAGKALYEQVGCAVCHGSRGEKSQPETVPVPLGRLETKYTVPALAAVLLDPLKARPSGRMPGMLLKTEEASQIAQYLLKELKGEIRPNLEYQYYELETSPNKLPDLAKLTPTSTGLTDGFDVSVAARKDNIALRFQGLLEIRREGQYTFYTSSDDGSRLFVNDNLVVDNDGTHPAQEKGATYRLGRGTHRIAVEYINAAGDIALEAEFQGPGLSRQPLAGFLTPKQNGPARKVRRDEDRFVVQPKLAEKGRDLFARIGCASCHQYKAEATALASVSGALPLASLTAGKGCLAEVPGGRVPRFELSDRQRAALTAALGSVATLSARRPTNAETITRTLTAFNCYACHQRDGRGGVQKSLNDLFATTQREMGDEGRLPPPLTGVGAKLNEAYLRHVVEAGSKDRPYMLTRMPRFGGAAAAPIVEAMAAVDRVDPVAEPAFDESARRVKSDGRFLVGGMALGCVKCHTFKGTQAEGIQAIDMAIMTRRLRRDWFHRYVVNPPAFRLGTRMPTGWPDGKSTLPKVLGGDTVRQVEAVWSFLTDGPSASEPSGLGREPMPLFVLNEPVIYRNFILGGGPRAIGVGYPEKANIAFDANDLRIAMIWQGGFMDASRHWAGRGEGFQPPMGDNPVSLPDGAPFARLASQTTPWPSQRARELGYHFRGYRLGKDRRPTFLYDLDTARVEDHPEGVAGPKAAGLKRTLTLTTDDPPDDLYLRVAVGELVKPLEGGWFLVNGEWRVRVEAAAGPIVRPSGGKQELLIPVKFAGRTATVIEHFEW